MDTAQEELIRSSSIAACVLERGGQIVLLELTGLPDTVKQATMLTQAGFRLHGVAGIVDGRVETAANDPLDILDQFNMGRASRMLRCLAPALPAEDTADFLRRKLNADDSVAWLKQLAALPDTRQEN